MKRLHVNTKDATSDELVRLAKKCGFDVFNGKKHIKVKTKEGKPVTTITRGSKIKRETAKEAVEKMNEFGADIEIN